MIITYILALDNCFSSSWDSIGEILFQTRQVSALAVDDDFNVYTSGSSNTLQKWPPGAKTPINLFEGRFQNTALFYHSFTHSLYFFYIYKDNPSVYKLSVIDDDSIPVNVINTNRKDSGINGLGNYCAGIYVTSTGDIFVADSNARRVVKWSANATSGVLVAGGNGYGSGPDQFSMISNIFVDEIHDILYVVDTPNRRIQKYTNGSPNGTTVIGGGPSTVFSDVMSEYIVPFSVLVDKMGNVLVGEENRITKWTPDFKSHLIVRTLDNTNHKVSLINTEWPRLMTFDKLENLYIFEESHGQVIRFKKNSTSCTSNFH